ncbi:hypothetical protein DFJ74DRAFT_645551 [Hyaloraphidium curvatum]|nr:hypothetical protein DFJ74DRAFT_645551 [Hyaloraphidium curvatum]
MNTPTAFRNTPLTCPGRRGARPVVRAAALLPVLALLATFPRPASPASYSGPSQYRYRNVTDAATGLPGCEETLTSHCCCAAPCAEGYSVCPAPCGAANTSTGFPYACGVHSNGLMATAARYEVNVTMVGRPGRCEVAGAAWLAVEAPRMRGGTWTDTPVDPRCAADADCPWAELRSAYGAALVVEERAGATYANLTLRPGPRDDVEFSERWCAVGMGCPWDLAPNITAHAKPSPDAVVDPGATPYRCLRGAAGSANVLVKLDGMGQVACLSRSWGDRECLQLTATCCSMSDRTKARGLPYLSCADVPAEDREKPDGFCMRGRALLAEANLPKVGPAPAVLGFNCSYIGAPDPSVDPAGAGPWTAVYVEYVSADPFVVARRHADGYSFLILADPADGATIFFPNMACAANAAATAPVRAPSRADLPFGGNMPLVEALTPESDKGDWICVDLCPGSGPWMRGRRMMRMAVFESVQYVDAGCTVPLWEYDPEAPGLHPCNPTAAPKGIVCPRMLAAVLGGPPAPCVNWTSPPPPRACIPDPARGDRRLYVAAALLPDGTTASVPRCWGRNSTSCAQFATENCTALPWDDSYAVDMVRQEGYTCGPEEGGWCRVAAEALGLRPKARPSATSPLAATSLPTPSNGATGSSAPQATSAAVPTTASPYPSPATASPPSPTTSAPLPSATLRPWTCVQSCRDKGNAVLVRPAADGRPQCLGPDGRRCSWFSGTSACGVLAPGEPAPDGSLDVGKICTDEEEGAAGSWCGAAKAALGGAEPVPCPTTSGTAGVLPTPRPSGAWLGRNGAGWCVALPAVAALVLALAP